MIKNVEKKFTKKLQKYNLVNFFRFFSSIIEFKNVIVFFFIFFKTQYISKNQVKNFLKGIIIIIILKNFIKRPRPFRKSKSIVNYDKRYFDEYSFPSGHSFTAFYIALALCCKIKSTFVKNILLSSSLIIALSRVYFGVHYISDIMFSLLFAKYMVN